MLPRYLSHRKDHVARRVSPYRRALRPDADPAHGSVLGIGQEVAETELRRGNGAAALDHGLFSRIEIRVLHDAAPFAPDKNN
jgi:hypothetical protein